MKLPLLIISTLIGSFAYAEESLTQAFAQQFDPPTNEKSTFYIRLGGGETTHMHALPGLGMGFRWAFGKSAVDLSANYSEQISKERFHNYFFTFPKISYLGYLTNEDQSIYYGAGLAWGSIRKTLGVLEGAFEEELVKKFNGVIPHLTVGYELGRHQKWCSFFEVTVSQPTIPIRAISSLRELPGPFAEAMIGLGF